MMIITHTPPTTPPIIAVDGPPVIGHPCDGSIVGGSGSKNAKQCKIDRVYLVVVVK